jgi:hypothetical protein
MKILTANRLVDGEAVWLAAGGVWIETVHGAEIANDAETETRLDAAGKAALASNQVVDVNLIDVVLTDGVIRPTRLREQIRADGPTTHLQFGKAARFRDASKPLA